MPSGNGVKCRGAFSSVYVKSVQSMCGMLYLERIHIYNVSRLKIFFRYFSFVIFILTDMNIDYN